MRVLLIAVNAKYIHSNPAVYSLRAYAQAALGDQPEVGIEIAEYTINQNTENLSLIHISVAYQIGNSAECVVQEDFTTSIRTEVKFSIPEEKLPAAGADITVKAVDLSLIHI